MPQIPLHVSDGLRDVRQLLVSTFGTRLREIRLFGSWAWGTPDDESDVDLCVIIEHLTPKERKHAFDLISDIAIARSLPLAALIWSGTDYDQRLTHELAIAQDIAAKGIFV